ncbi:pentapeptide repeat-containing protein [Microbacterium paludicola]|uniref:pentapeptide repeat-containing protein n=1 Tax=Microbacterium paludicola TaxID=300019 RepID=UPI00119F28D5|nr:pentapeptide repeat-containing protein [Microbacterium paludicola]
MARASQSPAAPRVSPPDLPPVLAPADPGRAVDLIAARLSLTGIADLAHATLEQCTITADADAVDLRGATLLDVDASEMRVASLSLRDANIRRVRVTGGRIGTLDLSTTRIDELALIDVRVDYLNLGAAKGTDLLFSGCSIRTLDMPQAQLTRARFDDCRSGEVDPRGLRAKDVDLRGLDAAAYIDTNGLRGATLSHEQVQLLAPALAAGVGIHVQD